MTALNPASTPVASSKTAALSRVLDSVTKGYVYYTAGTCPAEKAVKLAKKFHERYGIGCSPAQRMTRKKKGLANAVLVLYWPTEIAPRLPPEPAPESGATQSSHASPSEESNLSSFTPPEQTLPEPLYSLPFGAQVSWVLLATDGDGPVHDEESLRSVLELPRLLFLGYELVRKASRGKVGWTFRRTKQEMAELYALLAAQLNHRQMATVQHTVLRISRQPGFAGVRVQSWALFQFARQRGYTGELPRLYFVQKGSHGPRLQISE